MSSCVAVKNSTKVFKGEVAKDLLRFEECALESMSILYNELDRGIKIQGFNFSIYKCSGLGISEIFGVKKSLGSASLISMRNDYRVKYDNGSTEKSSLDDILNLIDSGLEIEVDAKAPVMKLLKHLSASLSILLLDKSSKKISAYESLRDRARLLEEIVGSLGILDHAVFASYDDSTREASLVSDDINEWDDEFKAMKVAEGCVLRNFNREEDYAVIYKFFKSLS